MKANSSIAISSAEYSDILSQIDRAAHVARIVASAIDECLVDGVDHRAAVMGIAQLIQVAYTQLAEVGE